MSFRLWNRLIFLALAPRGGADSCYRGSDRIPCKWFCVYLKRRTGIIWKCQQPSFRKHGGRTGLSLYFYYIWSKTGIWVWKQPYLWKICNACGFGWGSLWGCIWWEPRMAWWDGGTDTGDHWSLWQTDRWLRNGNNWKDTAFLAASGTERGQEAGNFTQRAEGLWADTGDLKLYWEKLW